MGQILVPDYLMAFLTASGRSGGSSRPVGERHGTTITCLDSRYHEPVPHTIYESADTLLKSRDVLIVIVSHWSVFGHVT